MKRLIAFLCAMGLMGAMTACQKQPEPSDTVTYTLHTRMTETDMTWNPHELSLSDDATALCLTGFGLTDVSEGTHLFEMATEFSDVTDSFADSDRADADIEAGDSGRVWRIKLNKNAVFADGTAITADDYVYSMQELLDSEMQNAAAVRYITGAAELLGAHDYYHNDDAGKKRYRRYIAARADDGSAVVDEAYEPGDALYFSFDESTAFGDWYQNGETLNELYAHGGETASCFIVDGVDLHEKYASKTVIPLSQDTMAEMTGLCRNFGLTDSDACQLLYLFAKGAYETTPWSSVGFYKENDYTLIYITARETTEAVMWEQLSYPFLVYRPLYEAGKYADGNRTATTYGTSPETTMAYGPYKLTEYSEGLGYTLTANKAWYGYGDAAHPGQFTTTDIVATALYDQAALEEALSSGTLDVVTLPSDQTISCDGCHTADNGDGTVTVYNKRLGDTVPPSVRYLTLPPDNQKE